MRLPKYLFWILLPAALFCGCNKQLNTIPSDFITPVNYFSTSTQVNQALAGVYNAFTSQDCYGGFMNYNYLFNTDEVYYVYTTGTTILINNYNSTEPSIKAFWRILYQGIYRANLLLDNIDKPTMDSTARNEIKGEALFLRAYCYYLLVTNWGDVPLVLTSTVDVDNVNMPRTPTKDVYARILSDMTAAEAWVNPITTAGYCSKVSKTAVEGILARVCLSMAGQPLNDKSKYADALSWATKVVNSGLHSLNPDYTQVFINESANIEEIKECIWEIGLDCVAGTNYSQSSTISTRFGIRNADLVFGYSYGLGYGSGKLYKLYDGLSTDVRRDWNLANFTYTNPVVNGVTTTVPSAPMAPNTNIYGRFPGKWRRQYEVITPRNKNYDETNFPVLRYADVLLMQAEAENEVNGPTALAFSALNQVRTRANATLFTPATVPSPDAFRSVIQDERLRELFLEGLRREDLIRWGIMGSTMQAFAADIKANSGGANYLANSANNYDPRYLLFPIPSYELSLNKSLVQNPGY